MTGARPDPGGVCGGLNAGWAGVGGEQRVVPRRGSAEPTLGGEQNAACADKVIMQVEPTPFRCSGCGHVRALDAEPGWLTFSRARRREGPPCPTCGPCVWVRVGTMTEFYAFWDRKDVCRIGEHVAEGVSDYRMRAGECVLTVRACRAHAGAVRAGYNGWEYFGVRGGGGATGSGRGVAGAVGSVVLRGRARVGVGPTEAALVLGCVLARAFVFRCAAAPRRHGFSGRELGDGRMFETAECELRAQTVALPNDAGIVAARGQQEGS